MGLDGQGQPGSRVRFLEDTDGDGRYDKSTVFLEPIGFATGVMPWRDGVIITAAPSVFYAEDTDGDGRADVRKTLLTGFHEGNQQHRTLAWLTSLRPEIGGYAMSHLAIAAPGQGPRVLTEAIDRNLRSPRFAEDGERILGLLESEGTQHLVEVPTSGGEIRTLWGGDRRVGAFTLIPGGGVVAAAGTSAAPM